jgi:alkylation response protein AidB-like acyl-CoA dehydrogenase
MFTSAAAQETLLAAESGDLLQTVIDGADTVKEFLIAMPIFVDPSDTGVSVRAEKENGGYVLTGSLEYLVLGGIAGHALVPAVIDGGKGYSFFLVDLTSVGLSKSDPVYSLGLHACPAVDMNFSKVPAHLAGREGGGPAYFETMTARLSIAAASMALGIMKGAFQEALDYARKRTQGGRAVIDWSEIKLMLADLAVNIKISEMSVSRACMAMNEKESGWEACSRAAAIKVQDMACSLTTDGIQVMGGVGYMKDFGQEKRFRDARHVQALFGMTPRKKLKYLEAVI